MKILISGNGLSKVFRSITGREKQMTKYYDERGFIITADELHKNFEQLKAEQPEEYGTFEQYVSECMGKDGTLSLRGNEM